MSGLSCCDVWHFAVGTDRVPQLHSHFPGCECERQSLRAEGGSAVAHDELLARVVTAPAAYDATAGELLTGKLTSIYSVGLSMIRSGATDREILDTIDELTTGQAEPQSLVGAVLISAEKIRTIEEQEQWFAVYATDAGAKQRHADLAGTFPTGVSNTKARTARDKRRYRLRDVMAENLVRAEDPTTLLIALRECGF